MLWSWHARMWGPKQNSGGLIVKIYVRVIIYNILLITAAKKVNLFETYACYDNVYVVTFRDLVLFISNGERLLWLIKIF